MSRLFVAVRTVIYGTGFVLLWGWIALAFRQLDTTWGFSLPAWTTALGIPLMAMGTAVVLSCAAVFVWRGQGTPAPFDAPRRFVAVGPYRYVRNPMYLGALGTLTGFALFLRSPAILLVCLLFLLMAHLFVLLYEEPTLQRAFGRSYLAYKTSVNRWIPKAPSARRKPDPGSA